MCRYDFFVVSQSVTQGSVSPTSYNVISDNTGLDPDKMQRLAYKLTHCYFNWSVSFDIILKVFLKLICFLLFLGCCASSCPSAVRAQVGRPGLNAPAPSAL
jgi:hypothetical protein